jgi:hypothetical protein
MEQEEFLFTPLFFRRVMKCIKDHECSLCGKTIKTGSSYFFSWNEWPRPVHSLKYCERCFDERLERPSLQRTEKTLDK